MYTLSWIGRGELAATTPSSPKVVLKYFPLSSACCLPGGFGAWEWHVTHGTPNR